MVSMVIQRPSFHVPATMMIKSMKGFRKMVYRLGCGGW